MSTGYSEPTEFTETVKVDSWRYYKKRGYIVIDEEIGGYGGPPVKMKSAYSIPDLYYIGNSKNAYRYWKRFGIEKFYPASNFKTIRR